MPVVKPSPEKSSSFFQNGLLTIIIPAPKSSDLLFSIVWLVFWAITFLWAMKLGILISLAIISDQAGSVTIKSLFVPLFFTFWLFMWGLAGFKMIKDVMWHLFGKEVLEINDYFFTIRRTVLGRGRSKLYRAVNIERLRVDCSPVSGSKRFFRRPEVTCLAFDYGADTIRFGAGIRAAEARQILERIQEYFPGYRGKIILR